MIAPRMFCSNCGAELDKDGEGVPAHPAPVCGPFMAGDARIAETRDGPQSCYFWDIRTGECRYEMLFLGCEPCAACPDRS